MGHAQIKLIYEFRRPSSFMWFPADTLMLDLLFLSTCDLSKSKYTRITPPCSEISSNSKLLNVNVNCFICSLCFTLKWHYIANDVGR